jgi:hypothetical protein
MRRTLALVLAGLALAACSEQTSGSPKAGVFTTAPPTTISATAGQCLKSTDLSTVECGQPHDAEVTAVGELTGLPAQYPQERDLRRAALPPCRAALAEYVGSLDADATRLQVRAFWPNQESWAAGKRWRVCAVVELTPDAKLVTRTGSVKGLLAAAGFATFQLCSADSPSAQQQLTLTSCGEKHLAEAVPGVLPLGQPTDPTPSEEQIDAAAREHCTKAVAAYLGSGDRTDVFPVWRTFGSQGWSEGFTNAICYAEATRPFTGRLWGIGTNALPS